jgi:hypothetical protein
MPQLVARGVIGTGSQSARAGMVVTAGGLIFIGTPDSKLRAYVAICVGAQPSGRGETPPSHSAGEYVVFALPAAARSAH